MEAIEQVGRDKVVDKAAVLEKELAVET